MVPNASAPTIINVLIPSGSAVSATVHLEGLIPYFIEVPANWSGPGISLQTARPGNVPANLYDSSGNEVMLMVTGGPGTNITIDQQRNELGSLRSASDVVLRAGSAEAPVDQGSNVTLVLHCSTNLGA